MAPIPLDTAPLDQLIADIEDTPDEVDGIDLKPSKQETTIQLNMVRSSVMRLRKLATPLPAAE